MPAGDGITFTYGDYSFDPRPLFTVNKEIIKTAGNSGLATKYSMTLNGNILPTGTSIDDTKGGLNTVFSGVEDLRQAFARDFNLLTLNLSQIINNRFLMEAILERTTILTLPSCFSISFSTGSQMLMLPAI